MINYLYFKFLSELLLNINMNILIKGNLTVIISY